LLAASCVRENGFVTTTRIVLQRAGRALRAMLYST
jgi:hypothetical protein